MVGIIVGAGEFLGYALRVVSAIVADRRGKLWPITFVGYTFNLLAVPALALANHWIVAAALMFAERIGRAIRKPTVESMLSYSAGELGKGWAYALNTALDETGATLGPLVMSLVLVLGAGYRTGYAVLLGSAALALISLGMARRAFPVPARLEQAKTTRPDRFGRAYWLYMAAGACFAAGLLSFELVTFHLAKSRAVAASWIPVLLALSTGLGVLASLALGKLFDRFGIIVVGVAVIVSATFAPLAFAGDRALLVVAMLPWGIGYATQDTLFKAIVAGLLPEGKRNLAFGLFYAGYGVGWLVGSTTTGLLYEHSRPAVVVFCVIAQLAAIPLLALAAKTKSG
jgi:hypothetical protein